MNLFVAGTDTNVGKSVVSALLCLKYGFRYWKPVQSGLDGETDAEVLRRLSPQTEIQNETYRLRTPLSPHASARLDCVRIDPMRIIDDAREVENTVIEGAGGLMVPLNDEFLLIDLIRVLGAPLILVARSGLGTINHTLLSLSAIRERRIPLLGVVMVGEQNASNRQAIEYYGHVRVLGELPHLPELNRDTLLAAGEAMQLNEVQYEYHSHA